MGGWVGGLGALPGSLGCCRVARTCGVPVSALTAHLTAHLPPTPLPAAAHPPASPGLGGPEHLLVTPAPAAGWPTRVGEQALLSSAQLSPPPHWPAGRRHPSGAGCCRALCRCRQRWLVATAANSVGHSAQGRGTTAAAPLPPVNTALFLPFISSSLGLPSLAGNLIQAELDKNSPCRPFVLL